MRGLALVLVAALLAAAVIAVNVRAGGTDFAPTATGDPCRLRTGDRIPARIEPLAERVVLVGLDEAACAAGVSRERLLLDIAVGQGPSTRPGSLKRGLLRAIERLDRRRLLPRVSELEPEILDELALPGLVRDSVELVPPEAVDELLPTGPVLRRSVDELDLERLLERRDDPGALEAELREAIETGARDQVRDRLRDELPDRLQGLLGDE